ncbi:V-type ATP synthase subunit E [Caproiciproducens sp.]|uniref:V-type ATP synthase subunit E n=1 Tax=Caproiciproducens sp. TaxID=1954376 RepID=UPI0028968F76|nr:V-type ATP synthase subunit E family protein [Caproiciproducens sp.]
MTGLEKIVQNILDEAETAAQQTVSAAEDEAAAIEKEARKQAAQQVDEISRGAKETAGEILKRAQSAAQLQKRRKILQAKQELIRDIIEKARQNLSVLPDDAYFDMIVKLAARSALPQEGKILFSPKDRSRLPADFYAKLEEALQEKGGSLKVSDETRDIDGGLVLVYGGVEENCSFGALFEAERERLTDRVNELLFR